MGVCMKFTIICSYLPSIINFRGQLLESLKQKGLEIHIIAPNLLDYEQDVHILQQKGYYLHNIPMQRTGTNPIYDIKTMLAIRNILCEIKADYVLAYTIKPVIYGILASWLAKVPHRFALITGLGYAFQNVEENVRRSLFQRAVHQLYKIALNQTEKVFFQNPDDRDLFLKLGLLQMNKPHIVVNGSGVNIDEFQVVDLPQDSQGQVKVSFLLIARLLTDKGVREYVHAAKEVKKLYPNIIFNLVGWIDENPNAITQQELDNWIAEDVVKYWGKLSDVRPAIQESSVYVLPSYREGTPRTVLEAMAMGRAIITTDAPGCRETVIHGDNGYLVEVKSMQSLKLAMLQFIENPALVHQMGLRSRQIALEKYDVHQINHHMIKEMGI